MPTAGMRPPDPELTLVVAATRSLGIGRSGTLPWTGLRREMQYFARVTTRTAPQSPPHALNALIMGRKTWDSIPPRFRPLKNRLNIVISRSAPSPPAEEGGRHVEERSPTRTVRSFDDALACVRGDERVSRVFVMGGGQVYEEALRREETRRVLLTSVEGDFECDVFFGRGQWPGEGAWTRCEGGAWRAWTGEKGEGGGEVVEEGGVRYEWQMWERA